MSRRPTGGRRSPARHRTADFVAGIAEDPRTARLITQSRDDPRREKGEAGALVDFLQDNSHHPSRNRISLSGSKPIYIWIAIYAVVLIWSAIDPKDQLTWLLEVAPAMIAAVALAATYKSFRFTPLAYTLILAHCLILMVGGHYTYAEVPLFDHLGELMGWHRNNYDKLGHFAQGFVPAIVAREIVVRREIIRGASWQFFFIASFCLGLSAFYELIEWWVALTAGEGAEAFLGTQGYVWDTQSDMALALIGAISALTTLSKIHDKQINELLARSKIN